MVGVVGEAGAGSRAGPSTHSSSAAPGHTPQSTGPSARHRQTPPAALPWAEGVPGARGGQGLPSTPECCPWKRWQRPPQRDRGRLHPAPARGGREGAWSPARALPSHLWGPPQWLLGASLGQGGQQGLPLPNDLHAAGSVDLEQLRDTRGTHVMTRGTHVTTRDRRPCPEAPTFPTRQDDMRVHRGTQASCDHSACHGAGPTAPPNRVMLWLPEPPPHGTGLGHGATVALPREHAQCPLSGSERPCARLDLRRRVPAKPRCRQGRRGGAGLGAGLTWMNRANAGVLARRASCSRVLMLSAVRMKADVPSGPGHQAPLLEAPSARHWVPGREPQRAPPSGCHARPTGPGPAFGDRVRTANARAARPAPGNRTCAPTRPQPRCAPAEAWPSGRPDLTIVCQGGQRQNQHPTKQTLFKDECVSAGAPYPPACPHPASPGQAPRGAPGSTSSVHQGGPAGQAGRNVARPRAHSHQKPALQGPPGQGAAPRPGPSAGPGQGAASRAWLPRLLLLWGKKAPAGQGWS